MALETRAGSPPSAAVMLERYWRIEFFDELSTLWERWEGWFVELAETHTSFPGTRLLPLAGARPFMDHRSGDACSTRPRSARRRSTRSVTHGRN